MQTRDLDSTYHRYFQRKIETFTEANPPQCHPPKNIPNHPISSFYLLIEYDHLRCHRFSCQIPFCKVYISGQGRGLGNNQPRRKERTLHWLPSHRLPGRTPFFRVIPSLSQVMPERAHSGVLSEFQSLQSSSV
ncbi:hypothetical protein AVEN_127798-1 [Araneus ventricosus]|uniref:Uncharacterized protein n=1 Tax=Araneus ventricosus TaxID=182803 RepID=A0A4Y2DRE8_ARAVE|nr:hypothetical protein AVEN_127798-1 [Araneus ventricosus]